MEMCPTARDKALETWDRLVLLVIAQPIEGWESEYTQIKRREIERLAVPAVPVEDDE